MPNQLILKLKSKLIYFIFNHCRFIKLQIMSQQKKVLWKKIGLEKHILDGTSHSSQSKNNISQQNSFVKQQNINMQDNQANPTNVPKNRKVKQNIKFKCAENQNFSESNSLNSPIDNLKFDETNSFQDKISSWHNNYHQQHQSRQYSDVKFQKNVSKDSQAEQFLQNLKKNSVEYDKQQQSKKYIKKKQQFKQAQTLNQIQRRKLDLFDCFSKSQIEMVQCQQMIVIPITLKQKYDKYERIETNSNKLITALRNIKTICKQLKIKNQKIKNQVILQRQNCSYIFKQFATSVDEQVEQFKNQIGYLYKQNSSLMEALSVIEESYRKSQNTINSLELKIVQINQQNQFLYNKLNSNQEKMEQIQQLQIKISYLQKELEKSFQRQEKARDIELTLMQKQRLLTISKKEIQNLKKQLNTKNQEFTKYQSEIQNKIGQFKFNFQLQKNNQIQSIKENLTNRLQKQYNQKIHHYETTIQELLKSLNDLQVQNIIKKFKLQKNENILNLISKNKHHANSNQNKADLQFSTLKNYINRNTTNIQTKNRQQSISNGSEGKISPSFKSQKSHSQEKYSKNDYGQNQERQRSLSTFSKRNNTIKNNIVVSNSNTKRKQFVEDGDRGKNKLILQDYEIQRKKSEINMQRYDNNNLTARQYNSSRIRTQIEQDSQTQRHRPQKNYCQSKPNQYSFSQLNYDSQNDQKIYHINIGDKYYNERQNQSQQSSTMIYLDMLQSKNQNYNYRQNMNNNNLIEKIKRRTELNSVRQKQPSKNYQQLVQKLNNRSIKPNQQYLAVQTSRHLYQKNPNNYQHPLPTYNSAVYQTQTTSNNSINEGFSYHPHQNNTFTKINRTTGNIITSSFAKNKQRERSKSPIPKSGIPSKTYQTGFKNISMGSSNSHYKQQSQESKSISRLLLARQFKKKH